jgi:hypothetical protein
MKLDAENYEVYINKTLVKKIKGDDNFRKYIEKLFKDYRSSGFAVLLESPASWKEYGYYVLVNKHIQECLFISYRARIGLNDINNSPIYAGDILKDKDGNTIKFVCDAVGEDDPKRYMYYILSRKKNAPWYTNPTEIHFDSPDIIKKMGIEKVKSVFDML